MNLRKRIKPIAALLGATALTFAASGAYAVQCDLTALNSTCTFNTDSTGGQAIYTNPPNTTVVGSGVIDPFLTVQATGNDTTESGYSTDATILPLDAKRDNGNNQFTRTFSTNQLGIFTVGAIQYFAFFLDTNEPNSRNQELISLDYVKLFDTNQSADVTLNTEDLLAPDNQAGWNLIYNLDASDDNSVLINDTLFNGSGNGYDMQLLIPVSVFGSVAPADRIVFATAFSGVDAGFEEWAYLKGNGTEVCPPGQIGTPPNCVLPPVEVPEPASLGLLGLAMAGLAALRRRRKV